MPTFDKAIAVIAAAFLLCASVVGAGAAPAKYTSPQDALDQGIGAYNGGFYENYIAAFRPKRAVAAFCSLAMLFRAATKAPRSSKKSLLLPT